MIWFRPAPWASLLLTLGVSSVLAAPPAPAKWAVPDAPYRASVRLQSGPTVPAAGIAITLPEFGATMDRLADCLLLDAKGEAVPTAYVYRGPGTAGLLVAKEMRPKEEYYLYF